MNFNKLLFGAAYYSEYLPYDRVDKDMELMEKAGMNTIRIAESTWSTLEPKEGVFDFTHLDKMLNSALAHNISVIIGTPTYAIPTWLVEKYPDIIAITHNGQELYGHRQNMDITHPKYIEYSEKIIRALMEHIVDYPNVIGFQIDNETKSYDTCSKYAQAMFVDSLRKMYPDINQFNKDFGLDYWSNRVNSWEDFPDIRGTINQSLDAEYKKFQRKLVTDFMAWQAKIISEYKRENQFITHNFDYQWINYSFGYQIEVNQFEAARNTTIAGCDIYHPSGDNLTGAEITCNGNITRGLKKSNYLILETQAQGLPEMLPFPGQIRLQAYSHIANGANSVMYWHWHSIHNAIESYWKGVLSHNFKKGPAYNEVSIIGNEFKRIGSHLVNLKKNNRIAIMLDNNSLTGLMEYPLDTTKELSYNTVMRWLADSLYRLNIEYDMINSSERDFSNYDCLIVPALYSSSDELLYAISDYVEKGGNLITTFKSGFSNEHLKINHHTQPHILHKCLGLTYDQFTYPRNMSLTYNGKTSDAKEWVELVSCTTGTSLSPLEHSNWKGYSAITQNNYGKGHTLYFATMFDEEILENVLTDFLKSTSLSQLDNCNLHFPIIVKNGINDLGKNITFYFNYSNETQHFKYNCNDGINLLSNEHVKKDQTLQIEPWNLVIIEH